MISALLPALFLSLVTATSASTEPWQECEVFLAPSTLKGGGWGAYAARDFEEAEIVEISPRFIPFPYETPVILNSAIDDYIYGYLRWIEETQSMLNLAVVVFGNVMFYNHNKEPNIKWVSFGREPLPGKDEGIAQSNGFVARRKISAGEELFSTYGDQDGGQRWFQDRGLELIDLPAYASRKNGTVYEAARLEYCSKVYSGIGRPTWENRVLTSLFGEELPYKMDTSRLAPLDHPDAVCTQNVEAGAVLEMAPALAVNKDKIVNTALAPMSFFWDDWDLQQRQDLMDLRNTNDLKVQHQDQSTQWVRLDYFDEFQNVVVFPAAGNIALVERVGKTDEANCMLQITSSGSSSKSQSDHGGGGGSAGIVLKLVATRNIKVGERLKLNVPANSSPYEKQLLAEELHQCGQPVPDFLGDFLQNKMSNDEL